MSQVLVLNATYEPLNVVSVRRAVLLLVKEKAEVVEAAGAWLRSERLALPVPLVIRLVYYVRIPRRFSLPLSRRTVLARDHYTCQYCGLHPGKANLTIDHILPRSRGGRDHVGEYCRRPAEAATGARATGCLKRPACLSSASRGVPAIWPLPCLQAPGRLRFGGSICTNECPAVPVKGRIPFLGTGLLFCADQAVVGAIWTSKCWQVYAGWTVSAQATSFVNTGDARLVRTT